MMGILIEWILYKRGSHDKMRNKVFLLAQTFLSKRKLYQRNRFSFWEKEKVLKKV
jgi:hypothetical protein